MNWIALYRHWPAALVASLGIVASLLVFDHAHKAAQDRVFAELTAQAQTRARDLQSVLSRYEGTIEGFASTFPQHVDSEQFRAYAKSISLASSVLRLGFHAIAWSPRVETGDRAAFEAEISAERHAPHTIMVFNPDGTQTIAPQRPVYFPLRFVEPERANTPLGLDIATGPVRMATVQKAIATGTMQATPTLTMAYGADSSLIYVPVYPAAASGQTGFEAAAPPIGVLIFRLSISEAIGAVLSAFEPVAHGVDLFVIDDAARPGKRLAYSSGTRGNDAALGAGDETAALAEPYWGSSFRFAGRDWILVLRATPQFLAERTDGVGWYELGIGLLLTAMLALYLATSRSRADRLRNLADSLRREIAIRRSAEDDLRLSRAAMDGSSEAICVIDRSGRYLSVNDATCQQLGYSRDEMQDVMVFDVAANLDKQRWEERWKMYKEVGSASFEGMRQTKNGRQFPVDITASHFQFGDKEYLLTVARDATHRRAIEHELRDARDREPGEKPVPRQYEPRTAHALKRDNRLFRGHLLGAVWPARRPLS